MGPIKPLIQWVQGVISPKLNRLGREATHSLPSSAEVMDDGAIPPFTLSLPGISLY
jgi:hypothetical protein